MGLLTLDGGDVEVHGPNRKKAVFHWQFFQSRCSLRESPIIILNLHKKHVRVRDTECS